MIQFWLMTRSSVIRKSVLFRACANFPALWNCHSFAFLLHTMASFGFAAREIHTFPLSPSQCSKLQKAGMHPHEIHMHCTRNSDHTHLRSSVDCCDFRAPRLLLRVVVTCLCVWCTMQPIALGCSFLVGFRTVADFQDIGPIDLARGVYNNTIAHSHALTHAHRDWSEQRGSVANPSYSQERNRL